MKNLTLTPQIGRTKAPQTHLAYKADPPFKGFQLWFADQLLICVFIPVARCHFTGDCIAKKGTAALDNARELYISPASPDTMNRLLPLNNIWVCLQCGGLSRACVSVIMSSPTGDYDCECAGFGGCVSRDLVVRGCVAVPQLNKKAMITPQLSYIQMCLLTSQDKEEFHSEKLQTLVSLW